MIRVINYINHYQANYKQRVLDRKFMADLNKNILRIEQNVLKREKQQELDVALAEQEITKYLPLGELNEAGDFLFKDLTCRRAISDYIWSSLEAQGNMDPSVPEIAREAYRICFSGYLRAHMCVTTTDEVKQ